MGLSQPRKRTKISHDPNNVSWARSTNGFGHKIMTSQGWAPGMFLGAQHATYVDNYTPASSSHIRVTLKDDNLGLGARPKGDIHSEPAGLNAFQGLLGRLNGKSQLELETEQRRRDDAKVAIYMQRRWQGPTFISGGLLTHDKWNKPERKHIASENDRGKSDEGISLEKQDHEMNQSETTPSTQSTAVANSQSNQVTSGTLQLSDREVDVGEPLARSKINKRKKSKKRKHFSARKLSQDGLETRQEVRCCKSPMGANEKEIAATYESRTTLKRQIPIGRHLIRGRHIHQKRKALMDDRSLSEIFMVKS